jgi:DNA-nicking Smr family endonuclease
MDKKVFGEPISDEELLVFRQAVKHVKPLIKQDKILLKKKQIAPIQRDFLADKKEPFALSDHQSQANVSPEDKLFFTRSGLSPKQIQKLRQGKIPIAARLDLHGYDIESARREIARFIQFAYKENKRYVIIIHGKGQAGKPILKNKINNWLRQIDKVLGFCTAIPVHGGAGALYVLLKSSHK